MGNSLAHVEHAGQGLEGQAQDDAVQAAKLVLEGVSATCGGHVLAILLSSSSMSRATLLAGQYSQPPCWLADSSASNLAG